MHLAVFMAVSEALFCLSALTSIWHCLSVHLCWGMSVCNPSRQIAVSGKISWVSISESMCILESVHAYQSVHLCVYVCNSVHDYLPAFLCVHTWLSVVHTSVSLWVQDCPWWSLSCLPVGICLWALYGWGHRGRRLTMSVQSSMKRMVMHPSGRGTLTVI